MEKQLIIAGFGGQGVLLMGQLLAYAGENGIAAYGVLMYVSMIFQALFIGYCVGSAPVVSFHYGAQNHEELKSLRRKSLTLISVFALAMFAAAWGLSRPLARELLDRAMELLERTNASILAELLVKMVTRQEKTPSMALYEAEIKMRELETKLGLSPKEPS